MVATVIEPLREDWRNVQATAETRRASGDIRGAAAEVQAFHDKLCETRVLDPACGTGNFLYVSLELMKRLEGEVLEALLDLGGQEALRGLGSHSVDPHQFLGLEINPRAAAIAELVLWIGYLQWHFRTKGAAPDEPILRAFRNIQVKNAVLTWDGEPIPKIVDGKETYPNARRPEWPGAEFVVGNPPFVAGQDFRRTFGDAYAEALWNSHKSISGGADLVMYWWDRAADLLTAKGTVLRRFGFVTTNSIVQEFSGRVVEKWVNGKKPISLVMAIPHHPWTAATPDAAAVRISMTVATRGRAEGSLNEVIREEDIDTDQPEIEFSSKIGHINPDLSIGTDFSSLAHLVSNSGICHDGVKLHGRGFIVSPQQAAHLGLGKRPELESYIQSYRNGRDITATSRNVMVIDLFGLTATQVRDKFPEVYQHLASTVKVEREKVFAKSGTKDAEAYARDWWIFGKPRQEMRPALYSLERYIATVDTAKHRVFQFLNKDVICDDKIVVVALNNAWFMGVLQSSIHRAWALRVGGFLEDRPVYVKSRCFDPFPFPNANEIQKRTIRIIAEELDAHRKRVLAVHTHLTLTGLYNVLQLLRAGSQPDDLDDQDRTIFDNGLVLILKELHDKLDTAVAEAYGWPADSSDDQILERLVALNRERSDEERRGLVRWLRPDYQIPRFAKGVDKQAVTEEGAQVAAELIAAVEQKPSFPTGAVEQTAAIFAALALAREPLDAKGLAAGFKRTRTTEKKVGEVLASLARLGYVASEDGKTFVLRRAA